MTIRDLFCALLSLLVASSPAFAQVDAFGSRPRLELHSNFWINLHHFLYRVAQPAGPPPRTLLLAPTGSLSADEQEVWDAAIAYYRDRVIQHDLLFDGQMRAVKAALARAEQDSVLADTSIGAELARVLDRAAPIYRRHWWPAHDTANRLWIAAAHPLLLSLGDELARQLATAYASSWPAASIRVDVTNYAGPRLVAYTTGTTNGHIVVSSTDPCDQGFAAVETLYHEASHTIVDADRGLGAEINAVAAARHVEPPRDLWHALMFYTQGEFLRRDLARLGITYEPSSGLCDVYRGPWALYRDAAVLFWRPHLFQSVARDTALTHIVGALSVADP